MKTRTALLVAVPLFLLSFGAAFSLVDRSPRVDVGSAMDLILADPAHTVCPTPGACVAPDAQFHALLFYGADDCSIGLYFTALVQELFAASARGTLNVVGLGSRTDAADARRLALSSGIQYALYTRPDRLRKHVADPRPAGANKPVLVLTDRNGTILRTVVAEATVQAQHDQIRSLLTFIGNAGT
jgi:hypothetical protein